MRAKNEMKEEITNIYRDVSSILNQYSKENETDDCAHVFMSCVINDERDGIIANGHITGSNEAIINLFANVLISERKFKLLVIKALAIAEEHKDDVDEEC